MDEADRKYERYRKAVTNGKADWLETWLDYKAQEEADELLSERTKPKGGVRMSGKAQRLWDVYLDWVEKTVICMEDNTVVIIVVTCAVILLLSIISKYL